MVHYFGKRNFLGIFRYYWHVKAENGEILCQSEAYNSMQAAQKGFRALCTILGSQGYVL